MISRNDWLDWLEIRDSTGFEAVCNLILEFHNPDYNSIKMIEKGRHKKEFKPVPGNPDTYIRLKNGSIIAFQYTTQKTDLKNKFIGDLKGIRKWKNSGKVIRVILGCNSDANSQAENAETAAHIFAEAEGWELEVLFLNNLVKIIRENYDARRILAREFDLNISEKIEKSADFEHFLKNKYYPSQQKQRRENYHQGFLEIGLHDLPLSIDPSETQFQEVRHILLIGKAGSGKSTKLIRELVKEPENENYHPILFHLRNYSGEKLSELTQKVLKEEGEIVSEVLIEEYLKEGRFCFLLDGFDEIPPEKIRDFENRILEEPFLEKNRLVVSSRETKNTILKRKLIEFKIRPINSEEIVAFIQKFLDNHSFAALAPALREDAQLATLLSNPFYLINFVLSVRRAPEGLSQLIQSSAHERNFLLDFLDNSFNWHQERLNHSGITRAFLDKLLGFIAFKIGESYRVDISEREIRKVINQFQEEELGYRENQPSSILEILFQMDFLRSKEEVVTFVHKIWLDFFCGRYVFRNLKSISEHSDLEAFAQPFAFYIGDEISLLKGQLRMVPRYFWERVLGQTLVYFPPEMISDLQFSFEKREDVQFVRDIFIPLISLRGYQLFLFKYAFSALEMFELRFSQERIKRKTSWHLFSPENFPILFVNQISNNLSLWKDHHLEVGRSHLETLLEIPIYLSASRAIAAELLDAFISRGIAGQAELQKFYLANLKNPKSELANRTAVTLRSYFRRWKDPVILDSVRQINNIDINSEIIDYSFIVDENGTGEELNEKVGIMSNLIQNSLKNRDAEVATYVINFIYEPQTYNILVRNKLSETISWSQIEELAIIALSYSAIDEFSLENTLIALQYTQKPDAVPFFRKYLFFQPTNDLSEGYFSSIWGTWRGIRRAALEGLVIEPTSQKIRVLKGVFKNTQALDFKLFFAWGIEYILRKTETSDSELQSLLNRFYSEIKINPRELVEGALESLLDGNQYLNEHGFFCSIDFAFELFKMMDQRSLLESVFELLSEGLEVPKRESAIRILKNFGHPDFSGKLVSLKEKYGEEIKKEIVEVLRFWSEK